MQIPFSALIAQQEVPSLGSVIYAQDYDGPRTTSATFAVTKHIRLFYRLFAFIGLLLIISILDILAIIIAYINRNSCADVKNIPIIIIVVAIIDLFFCGIVILIAIGRVIFCYHRSNLVCLCVLSGMALMNMSLLSVMMGATRGEWISMIFGFGSSTFDQGSTCNNSIWYVALVMSIYRIVSFFFPMVYFYMIRGKSRNKTNSDTGLHFDTLV